MSANNMKYRVPLETCQINHRKRLSASPTLAPEFAGELWWPAQPNLVHLLPHWFI